MACSITLNGLAQDCESNVGGVKNVYLAQYDASAASFASSASTQVTVAVSGSTFAFKRYYFRKGAASMTSTLNVDAANGTNFVSTELALTFAKQGTTKRIEISALVLGDVMAVVEDANGKMWFLGQNEPIVATAGGAQTGQAKTDANNYTLTLTDESETFPYELDSASVTAFKALETASAT